MLQGAAERVFQLAVFGDPGRSVRALSLDALDGIALRRRPLRRLAGVGGIVQTLFIHRDDAVAIVQVRTFGCRHRHVDGLLGRAVAVGIRDLEGEAVLTARIRLRLVAVRAVGIHRQHAVVAFHRHTAAAHRIVHRYGLAFLRRRDGEALAVAIISAEVVADLARHRIGRRAGLYFADLVRHAQRRHVVHDGHGDGAGRRGVVHVRHGHGKVMGNLRVPFGLITMLRGVAGKPVGERQLARGRVEARYRQDAFVRGNIAVFRVARESAVDNHFLAVDDDAGHAVGRSDAQRAFGRGGRTGLPGLRAVVKAGLVDRQLVRTGFGVTRRHYNAVVHAVDGDEHGTRGNVAVRIRIGIGEHFLQLLVVGKCLHLRIVIVERVAVAAVGVQRDLAVLALLRRVRPRKVRSVRTGCRTGKRVARDGIAVPFRHVVPEALDGGHVVGDLDTDHSRAAVAVAVRHHDFHFVGDGIVFAATLLAVFLGGLVQRIGIGQVRAVKAGHVQVPLIRLDGIARQGAVLPDDDTADGDGRHAVRGGDAHAAVGRRGAPAAAAIQGGFVHLEHIVRHGRREIFSLDGDVRIIRIRAGSGRRHGHAVVVLIIRARLHRICGQLHAAVEADVQTPQMVEAVQQVAAAVFVVAAAARGAAAGSGAGGGHQVFTKGREEILAADLHTFHLERRHLFLGIRGVEILQLDGSAILERQDEVVAAAGQRRGIRRKIKDEAPVRSAGDGLRGTSSRLGKTDIGHEGPPEKKWYLSKNR